MIFSHFRGLVLLLGLFFVAIACTEVEMNVQPAPVVISGPFVTQFLPQQADSVIEYRVTDTRFFVDGDSSTQIWLQRETRDSTFTDAEQKKWHRYRIDSLSPENKPTFLGRVYRYWDSTQFIEQNGLVLTQRLSRPLAAGSSWDPYPYNEIALPPWGKHNFRVLATDSSLAVGGAEYKSALVISELRSTRSVNYDLLTIAVYVPQLGWVYRNEKHLIYKVSTLPDGSVESTVDANLSWRREAVRIGL